MWSKLKSLFGIAQTKRNGLPFDPKYHIQIGSGEHSGSWTRDLANPLFIGGFGMKLRNPIHNQMDHEERRIQESGGVVVFFDVESGELKQITRDSSVAFAYSKVNF